MAGQEILVRRMSDTSILEADALEKFRPLAVNLCKYEEQASDENLLKWLRAKDLNVKAAEEMLKKAMVWRQENKIDEILTWKAPSQFLFDYAYDMDGEDYEGSPVFIIPYGRWDIRRAYVTGQKHVFNKYLHQILERASEKIRMKNLTDPGEKTVTQAVFIWDMMGLSKKQMTSIGLVDSCLNLCKRFEGQYPEIVKICIVVNVPKIFPWLFAILKPTLNLRTLDKIHVYGTNRDKWKPFLLSQIDKDQLPEAYGGTRKVTQEFLEITSRDFEGFDETFEDFSDMCVNTVDAGEKFQVALDVRFPNSIISWKFHTDDYDIHFSIFFESGNQTVVNTGRVDSHLKEQSGSYVAAVAGRYTVIFDNSDSATRPKTLYHFISEIPPDGIKTDATLGVEIKN